MLDLVRNAKDRFSCDAALECLPCTPTGGIEKFGTVEGAGRVIGKEKSTGSCVEVDGNCEEGATVVPEVTEIKMAYEIGLYKPHKFKDV